MDPTHQHLLRVTLTLMAPQPPLPSAVDPTLLVRQVLPATHTPVPRTRRPQETQTPTEHLLLRRLAAVPRLLPNQIPTERQNLLQSV